MKVNAGSLATEMVNLLNAMDAMYDDVLRVSGDRSHAAKCAAGYYTRALEIAKRHGFRTVSQALAYLESRTSGKWVYESGLNALILN